MLNRNEQLSSEKDLKMLVKWAKGLMKDSPEFLDHFDFKAHYDSKLNFSENQAELRKKFKGMLKSDQDMLDEMEAQLEKHKAMEASQAEENIKKYNEKICQETSAELEDIYRPIIMKVMKVARGYSNLAFIKGRGGIGKSRCIRTTLNKELKDKTCYVEVTGEVTEAFLYRLFYENNGKILWFKDVARLLSGIKSINLLKAATETEDVRVLTKSSYSKEQKDLPDRFDFTGRIIFDYNAVWGSHAADFEALVTRGDYIDFSLSMDDIKGIMMLIVDQKPEMKDVTEFLIQHYEFNDAMNLLNLRTQWRAYQTYLFCKGASLKWQEVLKDELENSQSSRIQKMIYSLIGNRAVRTSQLKKMLYRANLVGTLRTADNKVNEWLELEEIFKISPEDRNFYISLNPEVKPEDRT